MVSTRAQLRKASTMNTVPNLVQKSILEYYDPANTGKEPEASEHQLDHEFMNLTAMGRAGTSKTICTTAEKMDEDVSSAGLSLNEGAANWSIDPGLMELTPPPPPKRQSAAYIEIINTLKDRIGRFDAIPPENAIPSLHDLMRDQCFLVEQTAEKLFLRMDMLQREVSGLKATIGALVGLVELRILTAAPPGNFPSQEPEDSIGSTDWQADCEPEVAKLAAESTVKQLTDIMEDWNLNTRRCPLDGGNELGPISTKSTSVLSLNFSDSKFQLIDEYLEGHSDTSPSPYIQGIHNNMDNSKLSTTSKNTNYPVVNEALATGNERPTLTALQKRLRQMAEGRGEEYSKLPKWRNKKPVSNFHQSRKRQPAGGQVIIHNWPVKTPNGATISAKEHLAELQSALGHSLDLNNGVFCLVSPYTSQPLRMPAIEVGKMSGDSASGTWPYSTENTQQPYDSDDHESL